MGYSIATPIRSDKAKKTMMGFLAVHYNPALEPGARGPRYDLTYDPGPRRIGFDGTTISDYMIGVCSWMALKVGKIKYYPTKANPKVHGPHRYLVYDGREDWPLYICQRYRTDLKSLVQINWVGALVPKPRTFWELFKNAETPVIYEELKRLDDLWYKERRNTKCR